MWDVSCGCLLRGVAVWSTFPTWSKENAKVQKVSIEVVKSPCFCRCLCDGDVHTSMSSWATETTRDRDPTELASGGVLKALKDKGEMVIWMLDVGKDTATSNIHIVHVAHMCKIDGRTNDLWNDNDSRYAEEWQPCLSLSQTESSQKRWALTSHRNKIYAALSLNAFSWRVQT